MTNTGKRNSLHPPQSFSVFLPLTRDHDQLKSKLDGHILIAPFSQFHPQRIFSVYWRQVIFPLFPSHTFKMGSPRHPHCCCCVFWLLDIEPACRAESRGRVHANCHLIHSYQWSKRSWRMARGVRGENKPTQDGKTVSKKTHTKRGEKSCHCNTCDTGLYLLRLALWCRI